MQELYSKSLICIRTLFYFHRAELCIYRNIAWVRDKRVITIITFITLQICFEFLNYLHFGSCNRIFGVFNDETDIKEINSVY